MSEQQDLEPMMTEADVLIITRMSSADAPYSQRAQALLAINEGKTEAEAAEVSGLRPTQVKYWVTRYRKSGLAVFPEELLVDEAEEMVESGEMETAVSPEETNLAQTTSPQKKAKKKKKEKGKKQTSSTPEEVLITKIDKKKKKGKKKKKEKTKQAAKKNNAGKKSSNKKKKAKNINKSKKKKKAKSKKK